MAHPGEHRSPSRGLLSNRQTDAARGLWANRPRPCLAKPFSQQANGRSQGPGRRSYTVAKRYGYSSRSKISNWAVISLPLVSGPRNTAITYTISDPIVPNSIGLAKPICWFTA